MQASLLKTTDGMQDTSNPMDDIYAVLTSMRAESGGEEIDFEEAKQRAILKG